MILLAMSLTGLTWSFDWYRSAFYAMCGVEYAPRNGGKSPDRPDRPNHRGAEFGHWQQVYEELRAKNPDASSITIGAEKATVTLGSNGNSRASHRYEIDSRSGKIGKVTMYADADEAEKLRGWIYSIHTGSVGGLLTRILWMLGALLGASLPLTGYYIWIRHMRNGV